MPNYTYIEEATGQQVDLIVPIAQRDAVPGHRRVFTPPRATGVGLGPDVHSEEYQVRQGLKQMEEKFGADRIVRESGFTAETLKRAWAA